jgi:hypothetical protein
VDHRIIVSIIIEIVFAIVFESLKLTVTAKRHAVTLEKSS